MEQPPGTRAAVRISRIDLTGDERRLESIARTHLSAAERSRADRGTAEVRRRRILLRAALRQALGAELGSSPIDVPLVLDDDGRPRVDRPDRRLDISCSANGRVGLVAIATNCLVGIDVEAGRQRDLRAVLDEGWLCPAEERGLAALPRPARQLACTRCWTQKEAVLKARGRGLRQHPRTVCTPVAAAGRVAEWWLEPVPVPAGYVASIALSADVADVDLQVEDMTVRVTR